MQKGHPTGRGAYVCADSAKCWNEKRLKRAFGVHAAAIVQQLLALAPSVVPDSVHSVEC